MSFSDISLNAMARHVRYALRSADLMMNVNMLVELRTRNQGLVSSLKVNQTEIANASYCMFLPLLGHCLNPMISSCRDPSGDHQTTSGRI